MLPQQPWRDHKIFGINLHWSAPIDLSTPADEHRFEEGLDDVEDYFQRALSAHWTALIAVTWGGRPARFASGSLDDSEFELMDRFFPLRDKSPEFAAPSFRNRGHLGYCLHSNRDEPLELDRFAEQTSALSDLILRHRFPNVPRSGRSTRDKRSEYAWPLLAMAWYWANPDEVDFTCELSEWFGDVRLPLDLDSEWVIHNMKSGSSANPFAGLADFQAWRRNEGGREVREFVCHLSGDVRVCTIGVIDAILAKELLQPAMMAGSGSIAENLNMTECHKTVSK